MPEDYPVGAAPVPMAAHPRERVLAAQTSWSPEPAFGGVEQMVAIPDVRLACWESPGAGPAIVFLHPHTGSGAVWNYQHAAFSAAGFRVVSYSRRGYFRSDPGPLQRPGTAVEDLHALATALDIGRFHLVGSAAGGYAALDFALSHPDRVLSCTLASTLAGIQDPAYEAVTRRLLPPGWSELPAEFQEVGASYRAAYPAGVAEWLAHEERAVGVPVQQARRSPATWAAVEALRVPTLLLTGAADLYQPPTRMREMAAHLPHAQLVILAEAGHAAFWEQYAAFNDALLSHVGSAPDHG